MRIDSHHHFWKYDPQQYPWISDSMSTLKRDFGTDELRDALASTIDPHIEGVVSVQARQIVEETHWLLDFAKNHELVRGVVGWVPLADANVEEVLDAFSDNTWLKAVRHVVHDEPDDRFILRDDFNRGIAKLHPYGWVYDILIFAKHLKVSTEFVDRHPMQRFVVDHIAKPTIRAAAMDTDWEREFRELAKRDNVTCKFSGVVTEVRDDEWTLDTIRPYWDVALEAYGPERLMYGSDWPVCLLRSSYSKWYEAVSDLASELSADEQAWFWGKAATKAYRL